MKKRIITLIVAICLIIPCMLGLVACSCDDNKTATKTMKASINPELTFSLDANNKITSISYGNSDAGRLFANVNFVGKDANAAIQIMIEQSAISGHIDLNGDEITFEFTGEDVDKLKTDVEAKAKEVFNKLGVEVTVKIEEITAAAKHTALVATAKALAPEQDVEDLDKMTDAELIKLIDKKQKDYKDLAYDQINTIQNGFDKLLLDAIDTIRSTVNELQANMDKYGDLVPETVKTQFKQAKEELDAKIQEFLDKRDEAIAKAKEVIASHKDALVKAYQQEVAKAETTFKSHLDTAKAAGTMTQEQYNYWINLVNNNKAA